MKIFKKANLILIALVFLVASAAFGIGRVSLLIGKREPIAIEGYMPSTGREVMPPPIHPNGTPARLDEPATTKPKIEQAIYVGSKNGKSYYFPWCGTVKRIKPENLVYFNSKAEAEKAGYNAGRCSGLK